MPEQDDGGSARPRVIAIDGPVASGKTAVGRALARRLGWPMLDTGIMYRAVTWAALARRVPLSDPAALTDLATRLRLEVGEAPADSVEMASIRVDGVDVTEHLRHKDVEDAVSQVAQVPGVRECMVDEQRRIAHGVEMVMVGRDIGTVVVPEAGVKVYLDASPEVRARRRAAQIRAVGRSVSDAEVLQDLHRRDALDAGRATSPLRRAGVALMVDTSGLDLEATIEAILAIVRRAMGEISPPRTPDPAE